MKQTTKLLEFLEILTCNPCQEREEECRCVGGGGGGSFTHLQPLFFCQLTPSKSLLFIVYTRQPEPCARFLVRSARGPRGAWRPVSLVTCLCWFSPLAAGDQADSFGDPLKPPTPESSESGSARGTL